MNEKFTHFDYGRNVTIKPEVKAKPIFKSNDARAVTALTSLIVDDAGELWWVDVTTKQITKATV